MYNFTVSDVVREVRSIALEEPDFIYLSQSPWGSVDRCSYLTAGIGLDFGRGCIVGQALEKLGVSRADLKDIDGQGVAGVLEFLVGYDIYKDNGVSDVRWLEKVQLRQDLGRSWSEAVWLADAEN